MCRRNWNDARRSLQQRTATKSCDRSNSPHGVRELLKEKNTPPIREGKKWKGRNTNPTDSESVSPADKKKNRTISRTNGTSYSKKKEVQRRNNCKSQTPERAKTLKGNRPVSHNSKQLR